MANFTDETRVRLKTQVTDTTKVSAELVAQSIDDAHAEILNWLDPVYNVSPPDEDLVRGETLLSGAYLLRSVASGAAFNIKNLRIMDESVGETGKHDALLKLADRLESEAWELMAAFLLPQSGDADFRTGATESEDIVGETDGD